MLSRYLQNRALYCLDGALSERLANITKQNALILKARLDASFPLGINPNMSGVRFGAGPDDESVIDALFQAKERYPDAIVLLRVGDFYESFGIDSIFLAEYCGLNPMGRGMSKAGAPVNNLQAVLGGLTEAGLRAVICEQIDTPNKKRKRRFIAGVVSPESPIYSYGAAARGLDIEFPASVPGIFLREGLSGIDIVAVFADERRAVSFDGLTSAGAIDIVGRLGGMGGSLYIAESSSDSFLREIRTEILAAGVGGCKIVKIDLGTTQGALALFAERAIARIKNDLLIDIAVEFVTTLSPPGVGGLPRETIDQIGLGSLPGVPSLLDYAMPAEALAFDRDLCREVLVGPKTDSFARLMRGIVEVGGSRKSMGFTSSRPSKFIKTISETEASTPIFVELYEILSRFANGVRAIDDPATLTGCAEIVRVVTGLPINPDDLLSKSEEITRLIQPMVANRRTVAPKTDFDNFIFAIADGGLEILGPSMDSAYSELLSSWDIEVENLRVELNLLGKISDIKYDALNKAIYYRRQNELATIRPLDRNGGPISGFTTQPIIDSINRLDQVAIGLRREGVRVLKSMCLILSRDLLQISGALYCSAIYRLGELLAINAGRRGWSSAVELGGRLSICNGFPYWMQSQEAVKNSYDGGAGLKLLISPNMSGKSTYLRMVASVSSLAAAGFPFPAEKVCGDLPDQIFVRMGVSDDPARGLSSFAVEMRSLAGILLGATRRSVVLLDELGKGTSTKEATAIAAAVWTSLISKGALGIFSTHLHELLSLKNFHIDDSQIIHIATGRTGPKYAITSGYQNISTAIETAILMGVDLQTVAHAAGLLQFEIPAGPSVTLESGSGVISSISGAKALSLNDGEKPPIDLIGMSCVYLIQTKSGLFYVGETDDITRRVSEHLLDESKIGSQWRIFPLGYTNKSLARSIETLSILRLSRMGFPMLSANDGRNRISST